MAGDQIQSEPIEGEIVVDQTDLADAPTRDTPPQSAYPVLSRIGATVYRTPFAANWQGNEAAVKAAIFYGHELGMGPMQALQSINVIQGKPTLAPEAMRARVFAAGHAISTVEYGTERVTLRGERVDGSSAEVTWTMEDAKRAGLVKPGGAWTKYPRAMLLARATSELCRLLFPDVIAGVSYTPEEMGSIEDAEVVEEPETVEGGSAPPAVTTASEEPATPSPEGSAPALPDGWKDWQYRELSIFCSEHGLKASGKREALIERIENWAAAEADAA